MTRKKNEDVERQREKDAEALQSGRASEASEEFKKLCDVCNGTGSVPAVVGENNKVEKWKDCAACGGKGVGAVSDLDKDQMLCEKCNGTGKLVESFVDGKATGFKDCDKCNGSGQKETVEPEPTE